MEPSAIEAVFEMLDRELWLITAAAGEQRGGLIATLSARHPLCPNCRVFLSVLADSTIRVS